MKTIGLLIPCLLVVCACQQVSLTSKKSTAIEPADLYDPTFQPQPAVIVNESDWADAGAPTALVRLSNKKLALMVRDDTDGAKPFYVRGIETGFWDTRMRPGTDFDQVFANYRRLGANTSFFMIHWSDIEPTDGKFDFSYTDKIVELAAKNGVKIWWVLFLHCQSDHPVELHDFWGYKLDSRDGKDYTMQWLKDENGVVYDSMAKLATLPGRWEITPAYGHPEMLTRILRMLTRLGEHYRDSNTVIGVQIDNEAGFGYYTPQSLEGPQDLWSDFNPVTAKIFEEWKLKTGKSDWLSFKLDIVKYWWQNFTTAFHQGDPYKLTSFNFFADCATAGDPHWIDLEGVDVTTYGEGNIDVASSMFYGPELGPKIWANLDQHYNFPYELPIFISSEIGLGITFAPATSALFQLYTVNIIERGAQGYSSYDYGSLIGQNGEFNEAGQAYREFASMVEANEDVIHSGVPGTGAALLTTSAAGMKISQLHLGANAMVGILYSPEAALKADPAAEDPVVDVEVELKALRDGSYTIDTYHKGEKTTSTSFKLNAGDTWQLSVTAVGSTDVIFLRVMRTNL